LPNDALMLRRVRECAALASGVKVRSLATVRVSRPPAVVAGLVLDSASGRVRRANACARGVRDHARVGAAERLSGSLNRLVVRSRWFRPERFSWAAAEIGIDDFQSSRPQDNRYRTSAVESQRLAGMSVLTDSAQTIMMAPLREATNAELSFEMG
jgi:hypothetical protein